MTFPILQCNNCKQHIQSQFSGHFVSCKCRIQSSRSVERERKKVVSYVGKDFIEENGLDHFVGCILEENLGTGISIDSTPHYTRIAGPGKYNVVFEGDESGLV